MIEMLFVLSIITLTSLLLVVNKKPSTLYLQMLSIQNKIVDCQLSAMSEKKQQVIVFDQSQLYFNEENYPLSDQMVCDSASVSFNALGNINHADTICCYQGANKHCLKFQLGSGRCSID